MEGWQVEYRHHVNYRSRAFSHRKNYQGELSLVQAYGRYRSRARRTSKNLVRQPTDHSAHRPRKPAHCNAAQARRYTKHVDASGVQEGAVPNRVSGYSRYAGRRPHESTVTATV